MDDEQRRLVYRYFIARVGLRSAELPSIGTLADQMKNGFQVLAGGVVIDSAMNPPIIADEQDPAFFAAIVKGDEDAVDIGQSDLEQTRRFVLHDEGRLPPPFGRAWESNKPGELLDQPSQQPPGIARELELRKAAEEARWGTTHERSILRG